MSNIFSSSFNYVRKIVISPLCCRNCYFWKVDTASPEFPRVVMIKHLPNKIRREKRFTQQIHNFTQKTGNHSFSCVFVLLLFRLYDEAGRRPSKSKPYLPAHISPSSVFFYHSTFLSFFHPPSLRPGANYKLLQHSWLLEEEEKEEGRCF